MKSEFEINIESILKTDVTARGNDSYLVLKYWREFNNISPHTTLKELMIESQRSKRLKSAESITRKRRWFNRQGLYLPKVSIQKGRKVKEDEYHKRYGEDNYLF